MGSSFAVSEDEYEIPLRDQRYFGAGIKRKRIQFVPSATIEPTTNSLPTTPRASAADRYLSVVLGKPKHSKLSEERPASATPQDTTSEIQTCHFHRDASSQSDNESSTTCDVCKHPVAKAQAAHHESTLTHQICLSHSHPPSHIDRTRKGLSVLESQGWDPDSRLGLGAQGSEGRLYPVRAKDNKERAGLGARFEKVKPIEKATKLDAGKVRLREQEGKKKAERLRNAFYRDEKVEKYLGQDWDAMTSALDLAAFKRAKLRK
ncbi:hypothetical protein B0A50_05888 [Salinomyces thailandicus]|uniref:G-patch domain-containing protein n=1 Tax=Salinomyces thailandicus TaxID=706561 RepID=A0A4U0TSN8_9PEZI|nr:hypothetical protein B0A50_05888 [Salinomyces thailandica]